MTTALKSPPSTCVRIEFTPEELADLNHALAVAHIRQQDAVHSNRRQLANFEKRSAVTTEPDATEKAYVAEMLSLWREHVANAEASLARVERANKIRLTGEFVEARRRK